MTDLTKRIAFLSAIIFALSLAAPASSHEGPDGDSQVDEFLESLDGRTTAPEAVFENFELVGHNNLGDFQDYGDVWVHENAAYVGTRCGHEGTGGQGVRVIDISDPSNPTVVANLDSPIMTRSEDVVVRSVSTPSFVGDLAVVGLQRCLRPPRTRFVGMRFWDVTNPAHPAMLGQWLLHRGEVGCHEVDLVQRPDGLVLAGCARQIFDYFSGSPALHIVNATNPTNPRQMTAWSGGINPFQGVGCFEASWAHSVRFSDDGMTLWASHWDAGTVNLDISDPANPVFVSSARITPQDEDGDNHSMTPALGEDLIIINPEDFSPFDEEAGFCGESGGWGEAWLVDNRHPNNPEIVGNFSTEGSRSKRTDGIFTVHNTETTGNQAFSSWYSDGILWWEFSQDGTTVERGHFIPRTRGAPPALVWGVAIDRAHDIILGSDMISGLWIVKPVGLHDL